jgi:hypothetical protein
MNAYAYLGVVKGGVMLPLLTEHDSSAELRLTSFALTDGRPPEAGKISLEEHEGLAILVRGVERAGWIHSATVVERGGEIVSVLAEIVLAGGKTTTEVGVNFAGG